MLMVTSQKISIFLLATWLILASCRSDEVATATPFQTDGVIAATATATSRPRTTIMSLETSAPDVMEPPATPTAAAVEDAPGEPTLSAAAATTAPPTNTPKPDAAGVAATSIQLQPIVASGLARPVYLTHAFDERLMVMEQPGAIRIIRQGALLAEPFLDIRDRVGSSANEQGLLSVAFHPHYANQGHPAHGRFYINYTDLTGATVIASYLVSSDDPDQADLDSEQVLLTISQPYANHNGGQLQFGPDGYLYAGMGDGGYRGDPQGNGQNTATLLGALLRLDVDRAPEPAGYAIPADNPYVGDNSRRPEIWAIGLRNPWRFSFDRLTGDLFLADVGQNNWEEVHWQPAGSAGGRNYGWNLMEGIHCYASANCDPAGLELPIFEYDHGQGCSITGGYVYRGQAYPQLSGNYFVADYCSGTIWSLFPGGDGGWTANPVLQSGLRVSSFGQDLAGELYVLDHGGGVYQIQP